MIPTQTSTGQVFTKEKSAHGFSSSPAQRPKSQPPVVDGITPLIEAMQSRKDKTSRLKLVLRWPISTSALGSSRERMQSRKFRA